MRRKKKEWKILQKFCNLAYSMYLCPRQRVIETGWWLSVRSSCVPLVASARGDGFDKQITAEWGNENCCQFVTQIFLNPPNCLYLQKVCDFIQNYKIILAIPNLTPIIYLLFLQCKCFSALPWAQRHQDFLKFDHLVIVFLLWITIFVVYLYKNASK